MTTSYDIKLKQKTLLDYGTIISDTDKDLLTLDLSKYAKRAYREMIQDSITRARELRKELLSFGIVQFGCVFTDFDAIYMHTDYGYVRYDMGGIEN